MQCTEARRLLDCYLIELTNCENSQVSTSDTGAARKVRAQLTRARRRYWEHIQSHGCRQTSQKRLCTRDMLANWISLSRGLRNETGASKR